MTPDYLRENSYLSLFTPRPDRPIPSGPGTAVMVGRVATPTALIGVGKFLLVNPTHVLGAEVEGGAADVSDVDPAAVPVYLVGPRLAKQGDLLICRFVDHRWVAERGGAQSSGGHTLVGCPCPAIPDTIYMHVQSQPAGVESLVFPAPLRYQTKPSDLARYTTDPTGYYSDAVFTSSYGYYKFRYNFGCSQGTYFVAGLLTPDSPIGYPGRFLIRSWLVGLPGNTCAPFALTNGASNSTTFQAQGITIDGAGPA